MAKRAQDIRGFTLAELLLAIAIMVVLFALAVPSIFTVQKNMRMVELDAAASDIAAAAQQQMTSMKTSGTWLALFEAGGELASASAATGVPAELASDASASNDLYYMTAEQARASGILPAGSIDDDILNADFVIEYRASTASVFGVFYSDGKTGFFQAATNGHAAKGFYEGNTTTAKRTSQARLSADPLIGYYGGTPSGATNTVALANPNIWVNEQGRLCIQDTNLSKHPEWKTYLKVFIERQDGTQATLAFAGLQAAGGAMSYAAGANFDKDDSGKENLAIFDNVDDTKLYDVSKRDQMDTTDDVYVFDLDMLKTTASETLRELGKDFDPGKPIKVTATVATNEVPYIPADTTAYMEWPTTNTTVRVLVTNPTNEENAADGTRAAGMYSAPEVKLRLWNEGGSFVGDNHLESYSESHAIESTNEKLIGENSESAWQRYTGGQIDVDQAIEDEVNVEATVGSYTSASTRNVHWYQVQEIWLGVGSDPDESTKERVGYLADNKWQWVGSGDKLKRCIGVAAAGETDGIVQGEGTNDLLQLIVDTKQLSDVAKDLNISGDVITIYVRTAPSIDDARMFFTGTDSIYGCEGQSDFIESVIANMTTNRTTGARGVNHGSVFRKSFESEFGCASSVAMWTVARQTTSGQYGYDNKSFPTNNKDIRIYYGITPAYGFSNELTGNTLTLPDYESTNAALWYFSRAENKVYPQAMVDNHGDSTGNGYFLHATKDGQSTVADFEFRYDRDDLFYRLLKYYVRSSPNGPYAAMDSVLQYVPFSLQNDENVASILPGNSLEDKSGNLEQVFSKWTTEEIRSGASSPLSLKAGEVLGIYDEDLAYVGTSLYAQYEDAGLGMMYLEFGAQSGSGEAGSPTEKQVTGYWGYLTPGQEVVENLLDDSATIRDWGYYVLVPAARDTGAAPKSKSDDVSVAKTPIDVVVEGNRFKAYQVTARGNKQKASNLTASYYLPSNNSQEYAYTINVNFACAVAANSNEADNWGGDTPWQVRHATQFPGALSLNDRVQATYVGHAFKQTHTIDMADVKTFKFDNVFSGSYDGGSADGHTIKNVQRCLEVSYYVGNSANASASRGSGMFPKVVGETDENKAQIKNVSIVISGSDFDTGVKNVFEWRTNSPYAHLGILIGTMQNCDVQNCSIAGDEENVPTINLILLSSQVRGWGVLFGGAENCTVADCSVNSIEFIASRDTVADWYGSQRVGGLGGQVVDTEILACSVTDVQVGTTQRTEMVRQDKGVIYIGGLVGEYSGSKSCNAAQVTNVTLRVSADQYDESWKYGLYYGGLAGANSASFGEGCTYENVKLKTGDEERAVTKPSGVKPGEEQTEPPADPEPMANPELATESGSTADPEQNADLESETDSETSPQPETGSPSESAPPANAGGAHDSSDENPATVASAQANAGDHVDRYSRRVSTRLRAAV